MATKKTRTGRSLNVRSPQPPHDAFMGPLLNAAVGQPGAVRDMLSYMGGTVPAPPDEDLSQRPKRLPSELGTPDFAAVPENLNRMIAKTALVDAPVGLFGGKLLGEAADLASPALGRLIPKGLGEFLSNDAKVAAEMAAPETRPFAHLADDLIPNGSPTKVSGPPSDMTAVGRPSGMLAQPQRRALPIDPTGVMRNPLAERPTLPPLESEGTAIGNMLRPERRVLPQDLELAMKEDVQAMMPPEIKWWSNENSGIARNFAREMMADEQPTAIGALFDRGRRPLPTPNAAADTQIAPLMERPRFGPPDHTPMFTESPDSTIGGLLVPEPTLFRRPPIGERTVVDSLSQPGTAAMRPPTPTIPEMFPPNISELLRNMPVTPESAFDPTVISGRIPNGADPWSYGKTEFGNMLGEAAPRIVDRALPGMAPPEPPPRFVSMFNDAPPSIRDKIMNASEELVPPAPPGSPEYLAWWQKLSGLERLAAFMAAPAAMGAGFIAGHAASGMGQPQPMPGPGPQVIPHPQAKQRKPMKKMRFNRSGQAGKSGRATRKPST